MRLIQKNRKNNRLINVFYHVYKIVLVNFLLDEMLETESRGVAGRVADLERKVLEQGDELVCLKATLAEALRRLSILEGLRNSQSPTTPTAQIRFNGSTIKENNNNNRTRPLSFSASKTEQRRIYNSSLPQRKAVHYQSTGSLHSDSQSSSSASPIPSPSPRATPLPLNGRKTPSNHSTSSMASSTTLHKRWSSTGDFNQVQNGMHSKLVILRFFF